MSTFELAIGDDTLVVMVTPGEPRDDPRLTAAERAIARSASRGLSNAQIAAQRASSVRTVANQLASIYRKLGVFSRAELANHLLCR